MSTRDREHGDRRDREHGDRDQRDRGHGDQRDDNGHGGDDHGDSGR